MTLSPFYSTINLTIKTNGGFYMLNPNQLLKKAIEQVEEAGIKPGNINPIVEINDSAKSRFGLCTKSNKPNRKYDYEIQLNKSLLSAKEKAVMEVLVHEVLHSCEGCMNHGKTWKLYVSIMNQKFGYNISRCSSYEKLGIESEKVDSKYIIECVKCKRKVYRNRKSKFTDNLNQYICNCGGDFNLIKSPYMKTNGTKSAASSTLPIASKKPKYVIECKSCGVKVTRSRKSKLTENISRYKCKCGGKLKLTIN